MSPDKFGMTMRWLMRSTKAPSSPTCFFATHGSLSNTWEPLSELGIFTLKLVQREPAIFLKIEGLGLHIHKEIRRKVICH